MRGLAILVLCPALAHAYPLLAPRPIGNAIAGPADPQVAAMFYNPAALGPLKGLHFWMDGSARVHEGNIALQGGAGSSTINYTDADAFIGVTWDAGTDSITFGLSTMVPYSDLGSFGDSAVRYHSVSQQFVDYQQSFAVAVKISSRFFVGVGANFMESWMNWRFDRDAALSGGTPGVYGTGGLCGSGSCGLENPAAREQLRLRGFGAGWSVSVGVLGRAADRLWLALSYTTRTFNYHVGSELNLTDERGTTVSGPGVACTDDSGRPTLCQGNASVSVYVPDLLQAAARIEINPRTEIETTLRWIHYGGASQLDIHTQGGTLDQLPAQLALPASSRRDLGLQDSFGAEVSLRFRVGEKLRLSPSLFFETSAVEASAVSATALDAPKLDLALTAEWRPIKHLVLGAHVGGTAYFLGTVHSRNDPADTIACVDSSYSLSACGKVESGAGLPSASGQYSLFVVHLGAAVGFDY